MPTGPDSRSPTLAGSAAPPVSSAPRDCAVAKDRTDLTRLITQPDLELSVEVLHTARRSGGTDLLDYSDLGSTSTDHDGPKARNERAEALCP